MARENDNNVEVIDPEDRRYKISLWLWLSMPFFTNHFYFCFQLFYLLLNWMF